MRFLSYKHAHHRRSLFQRCCLTLLACVVLTAFVAIGRGPDAANAQPVPPGLLTEQRADGSIVVTSPDRFELQLDDAGIFAWYDLARDPGRATNMVAPGARLLEHATGGSRLRGQLAFVERTPVRAILRWQGAAGQTTYTLEYAIWAAGQVAVSLDTAAAVTTTLHRADQALSGATFQVFATNSANGAVTRGMLYLDAWTGEPIDAASLQANLASAKLGYQRQRGAFVTSASSMSLRLQLPVNNGLRQPRFEIANWPNASVSARHNGHALVAGADYLTAWNATAKTLTFQYLHLLPPSSSAAVFELQAAPAATALQLGIKGRDINEQGLLKIGADLPATQPVTMTTALDIFYIPYIQSKPDFTATAIVQDPPAGAGVEFVLDNGPSVYDDTAPFEVPFVLSAMGEHQLTAYVVDANRNRLDIASDTLSPLGYGHMLLSIGDSITAGKWGLYAPPTSPVSDYTNSPESSADRRNIYQYDNGTVSQSNFFRGYQLDLNNQLTTCTNAPVFILNDGISSLRAANIDNTGALSKIPAYNSHIDALGIRDVLLQLGTNDASSGQTLYSWKQAMNRIIDGLQTSGHTGLSTWIARIPFRKDGQTRVDRTIEYNDAIPGIVSSQNSQSYPVYLGPDFFTYFQNHTDQFGTNPENANAPDAIHPSQTGLTAMANLWKTSLCERLVSSPPPTAVPTTPPGTTPTATTPTATTPTATVIPTPQRGPDQRISLPLVIR